MPISEQPTILRAEQERKRRTEARAEAKRAAPLTVSIMTGTNECLFKADYSVICEEFRRVFADVNAEPRYRISSPGALYGTTIDIFVNLLVIGGGIVAAEMLKEIAKDLWSALKDCVTTAAAPSSVTAVPWKKQHRQPVYDTLKISVSYKDTELCVGLHNLGPSSKANVRRFVNGALPALGELVNDLTAHNGWSGAPFADRSFRLVANFSRVWFDWTAAGLVLRTPICVACDNIETPHEAEPCWSCTHYLGRTAGVIAKNAQGQYPPKEADHFRSWTDPRLAVPSG